MLKRFSPGLFLIVVGVLLFALPSLAQTQAPNEVYVAQSFQVAGTHGGADTTEYRLYRAGTRVATVPASARNTTTGEVLFPARTEAAVNPGVLYEMTAANVNTSGEAESPRLALTVIVKLAPPTAPLPLTLPKIIRIP